ncbi:MAG TPA: hypothetical protein VFB35_04160 [Gaiellaceae bacterium]|nr:hypothetical protein [Gaiellaceae bacterium]
MRGITLACAPLAVAAAFLAAGGALAARSASIAPHVYSTKIARATPAVLNGTWRLTVKQTTFTVAKGAALAVTGSVTIAGTRITFHDVAGPFSCRGAQATGVYSWRIAGTKLALTAVREPCGGRRTILTKPFTRVL